jgi:hypothetical protein
VFPTGVLVLDDSLEQLGLSCPGHPLQQDFKCVLALSPKTVGSRSGICG